MKIVDIYVGKRLQVVMAHRRVRKAIEPRVVRNERDDTLPFCIIGNAPLGNPKKSNVEVVEALSLRRGKTFDGCAVLIGEVALLFDLRNARIAVVRRVAEDH